MKITSIKQTVTVQINESDSVYFFERNKEGSKNLALAGGEILGNSFRQDFGLNVKKNGHGKFKKEKEFFETLEAAFEFLKKAGYDLR